MIQERSELASPQLKRQGTQFVRSQTLIRLAAALAIVGTTSIAPSALSQSVGSVGGQSVGRAIPEAVEHSTCVTDLQGLMCNSSSHESAHTVATPASTSPTVALQPLSNAQMERLSNVLLGILYFVLPIGFGLGLFLHDRHQAQRAVTLEAQIKLLEKLWEQSPQA